VQVERKSNNCQGTMLTSLYSSNKKMTSLIKLYCVIVWSTQNDCGKCLCYGPVKASELVYSYNVMSMAV